MRTITHRIHEDTHPEGQPIWLVEERETVHFTTGDETTGYVWGNYFDSREAAQAAIEAHVAAVHGEA